MLKNAVKCAFVFATTGADPDVQAPRDNVRRHQRLYRPFLSSFPVSFFNCAFPLFSPSFRARHPRTVFLLGFPLRTVRPLRPVSLFLGRLFSAHIRPRRDGQRALPQRTLGGRHRLFVSHSSKPAVATESLPDAFVLVSPTVPVE